MHSSGAGETVPARAEPQETAKRWQRRGWSGAGVLWDEVKGECCGLQGKPLDDPNGAGLSHTESGVLACCVARLRRPEGGRDGQASARAVTQELESFPSGTDCTGQQERAA